MHEGLDARHSALIHRFYRLGARLFVAIAFAVMPLAGHSLDSLEIIGVYVSPLAFLVILETVGKIGAVADHHLVAGVLERDRTDNLTGEPVSAISTLEKKLQVSGLSGVEERRPELTDIEQGADDAGMEGELGRMQATRLGARAKTALAF